MTIAFVLGNGVSRKNIDLEMLKQRGKVYGCNALYRDFTPDILVATDRPIATEIQNSGYSKNNRFYTRRPIDNLGALKVPQDWFGNSSGPIAVGIATLDNNKLIYLIGFDMGPVNDKFNNIYANTEFYKKSDAPPTYTGNWSKQLSKIIKSNPTTKYIRIIGPTTAHVPDFDSLQNLQYLDLDTFVDRINNKKDL